MTDSKSGDRVFRTGEPELVTSGPTSQEGIEMAGDGKSFITSVGSRDSTVWLHDKDGDHQISSEGNAAAPSFSSDGNRLYYLVANGQTPGYELLVKDLIGEKIEKVLPGYPMAAYSVSRDGKEVAFAVSDPGGHSALWVAPTDHRSSPRRISLAGTETEDSPFFLPDGDLIFRAIESGSNFLYRMKADGSGRQKISSQRIFDAKAVSPDGRWVIASIPVAGEEHTAESAAFAVDGGLTVPLCPGYCLPNWNAAGTVMFLYFPSLFNGTYPLPVKHDSGLPTLPPSGFERLADLGKRENVRSDPPASGFDRQLICLRIHPGECASQPLSNSVTVAGTPNLVSRSVPPPAYSAPCRPASSRCLSHCCSRSHYTFLTSGQ
jgi:hypothetical protein